MGLSLPHLIILSLVVLILFGRGKISELMGDFGKGVKSFKQGMADRTVESPRPQISTLLIEHPQSRNLPITATPAESLTISSTSEALLD